MGTSDTVSVSNGGGNVNVDGAPGSTKLVVDLQADYSTPELYSMGTTSTLLSEPVARPRSYITYTTTSLVSLEIDTAGNDDQSLAISFDGGNPIPTGSRVGLIYNAGTPVPGGSSDLSIGGELPSGGFASEVHNANDPTVTPTLGQYGSIFFTDSAGVETGLDYIGLQPGTNQSNHPSGGIGDGATVTNYTFNDFALDQSFTATDSNDLNLGFDTIQFANTPATLPPTFEMTNVANKTNIVFNTTVTGTPANVVGVVNVPTASPGLASLMFNTPTSGTNAVSFVATPPSVATSLAGGPAQDVTNVTGAGVPAGVTLVLDGGAGTNTLNYGAGGLTPTVTSPSAGVTLITLPGFGSVQATNYQSINQSPAITSAAATSFAVGIADTFTVTTTGVPAPALSETGALPIGVTFVDNGDGTATLGGTAAAATGGTYALSITAANGVTPDATQSFTLSVDQAPVITSAAATSFAAGMANTFMVTTTGTPISVLGETGALPAGVIFVYNGDGTATIAGTPAAGTAGTYALLIIAANGVTPNAIQSFTLTVAAALPPAISSAADTTFTTGTLGTFTITTAGVPTPALSETGALPAGVTFADDGGGTAALAGTPAAGTGGTYALTFTAANGVTPDATQSFTLTVDQAPAITSAAATAFAVGQANTFTVTTTGFPISALSETGALPSGVSFVDHSDGTAALAGTPAAGTGGTYALAITAANGVLPDATQSFTLTVAAALAPAISSAGGTTFTTGTLSTFTVTTSGVPTPSLTETGALPTGVTFVDNGDGTAALAGTPAVGTGGTYTLSITAANSVLPDATQNFTLTVNQAPAITSAAAAPFAIGLANSFTVTTTGFPISALSETSALPTGVTFVDNGNGTATLAGTPAAGSYGAYPLTFTAANGVFPDAIQSFILSVAANQAPAITSFYYASFTTGTLGTFTVTTIGFPIPALSETGALPAGVTFVDNGNGTAAFAGTPAANAGGRYAPTITAANGVLPDATQSFTLVVIQATAITSAPPRRSPSAWRTRSR